MLALMDQIEPVVATEPEAAIAETAAKLLRSIAEAGHDIRIVVQEDSNIVVPLPARAVGLIMQLLESMSQRIPVSIIPHEAEMTTQQAADFLNVSRPFLVGLLERDEIPFRKVGSHRRVRFGDLIAFEKKSQDARQEALKQLAEEAIRLGLE